MRVLAMAGAAVLVWGGSAVAGPTRGPAEVATGQGSNYAAAKATCVRQGQQMRLVATQTTDKTLASGGVAVTAVCVARPVKVAAKTVKRKPAPKR